MPVCPINAPRILFVHEHLGAFGGAEVNIALTAAELRTRGYEVGLLYDRTTGKDESAWRSLFSPIYQAGSSDPEQVVAGYSPDIIYVHNPGKTQVLESLLKSRRPVVRMVHDHSMYCMRGYKYNYFTRHICTHAASFRCVFPCLASVVRNPSGPVPIKFSSLRAKKREIALNRRCDSLVVYSDYSRQELIRNGFDPERIHIHAPIRCEGDAAPWSRFSAENLILFAGQIIRGKGVDMLLKALARIKVPFHAVIMGDGNHRKKCEKLAQALGLADRVQFTGYVPPGESREFYLRASVLAVSSLWPEPFGMVGPEAMRYGLPVVAFDAGGISEWLINGENGYLVPWAETGEFATRIEQLLMNKDLARELGRNGRDRVNRVYNVRHQVNVLEALFNSLLAVKSEPKGISPAICV
jgi:glycosyltransferase involved in cell wall biosynthesis